MSLAERHKQHMISSARYNVANRKIAELNHELRQKQREYASEKGDRNRIEILMDISSLCEDLADCIAIKVSVARKKQLSR